MIKVSCPSCDAAYDVDEKRLPANGLRMRCPKCDESFQVHRDGTTAKSGGGASPGSMKPPRRKPTQVGLGPNMPPPGPPARAAAPKQPPSDLPMPAEEVDLPAPFEGGYADLPAPKPGGRSLDFDPFADDGIADLPAPKSQPEPSPSGFDPFADLDLPAPLESPGGVDLPAPMTSRGGSDVDLPAPLRGGQARAVDLFGEDEDVDLPMAMTDADLPKPMPQSSLPEPISLDSELPIAREDTDLPVARDDFADLELDGPERAHGGGPIELDLPDGEDLDLDMDLDPPAPQGAQPPPLGHAFGAPGAAPTS